MAIATVSSKGQITLPAEAREALGIRAHDRVLVRVHEGAIVIEPVADFFSLKGSLGAALPRDEEEQHMQVEATRRGRGRE